jgi:outer membrane lipoprotein SlyB
MRPSHLPVLVLVPALLSACVTTTTTTRTMGEPYGSGWARNGHVEWVRETVQRSQGNPAAGAVAGAAIGGILGSMLGGRSHHGYYRPSAAGVLFGAAGGAMVGAAASQGGSEDRLYEVFVRFDDGGYETFAYRGYAPFGPGDAVQYTANGLMRM